MKLYFKHPYKENLAINFGKFTQVVGEDQQLKYYIWQLLVWYFGGKKYNTEDLTLFEQSEPEICTEEMIIKRSEYKIVSISNIQDLIEQMNYKKGTVAFDFLKSKLDNLEVMEQIDFINDKLDQISAIVNKQLNFQIGDIDYHTESVYLNVEQLILKNFLPYFGMGDKNISFEFVENETKFLIFLTMLQETLLKTNQKIILLLRSMDDYLTYQSFVKCCKRLQMMTEKFPNIYVISFPSNEGYLYINRENMEFVNIISGFIEHYYEFRFMYESFVQRYPSNEIPNEEEFLISLQKISPYLFSSDVEHMSLSIYDMVTLKIMNSLYQYDKIIDFKVQMANPLLTNFLKY
ncbi:CRISPR-associated protein Csn2-St [Streptococcus cristatus]|uniref:CRISPR-associated protein Cas7 n=1 Tax=Streptococcus cristatus TaxID=45634 RepID=A0A428ANI0_STRCR|nr:CRISPR-associated protein Csn2-St [Streptococcus cristatus]RSI44802.1 hypothetical protein D8872_02425 [Streptococcus cristatus]